jgi:diaminopimelate decarboxylase
LYENTADILQAAEQYGTPVYLYDEGMIVKKCGEAPNMPSAFGLTVRYAMKANSNRTLLPIIDRQGLYIDASSLIEIRRAYIAGIDPKRIMLSTQEVPENEDRAELERFILNGLTYNVCSLRQLYLIGDFVQKHGLDLSVRIHPGIGSGADPFIWWQNIDLEMAILEEYFPYAETVNFGGGLKEARMPDELPVDIAELGEYAKQRIRQFKQRTGRKLRMEIEPGAYIVANEGYAITRVIDKKERGRTD